MFTYFFHAKRFFWLFGGWVCIYFLSACTATSSEELETFLASHTQPSVRHLPSLVDLQPVAAVTYTARGRRDPFVPQKTVVDIPATTPKQPRKKRGQTVLQRYPLESFRMVGTASKEGMSWGLLESTDGNVHRVAIGDSIGLNQGRIQAVYPDKLIVLEPDDAETKARRIVLAIDRAQQADH
jgi:type IV pilus assembly protein PilP